MRSKPTLRTNPNASQGSLKWSIISLGDNPGGVDDSPLHLLLILHRREFAGNHAQNDILVWWKVLQWLEAAGALGVVLEIVRVDIQFLEQLHGNAIVPALGEVATPDEVSATQVHAHVHVFWKTDEAVVV